MKTFLKKRNQDGLDIFDSFRKRMENVFEDFMGNLDTGTLFKADFVPKVDIEEDENKFMVKAEIPGATKDDIEVTIKDNVITIKGEKKQEKEENKDKKAHVKETVYGMFERTFTLPDYLIGDKAKAGFKDGILTVEIPKEKKAENKHKIAIE